VSIRTELDFIDRIEGELALARELASRAADRADALAEIRSRAIAKHDALNRRPTAEEVMQSPTEQDVIDALVDRVTQEV